MDWNVEELSIQEMIGAMTTCNGAYDGRFYAAVISTGIYCLPSCKAKLPLIKNVVFYPTREEAVAAGLRGCRRCRAEQFPDRLPGWLHELLGYMKRHRNKKLSEADLMGMAGVDISTVRGYFKDHISMTPLAFHRKLRLNYARELLGSGMWSTSGLRMNVDTSLRVEKRYRRLLAPGGNRHLDQLGKELVSYWNGTLQEFSVPIAVAGTAFERMVWEKLLAIHYGATKNYGQIAEELDKPGAARAVGRACGANYLSIVIPCHRVIEVDGNLRGYGGKLWRKKQLLSLEAG